MADTGDTRCFFQKAATGKETASSEKRGEISHHQQEHTTLITRPGEEASQQQGSESKMNEAKYKDMLEETT